MALDRYNSRDRKILLEELRKQRDVRILTKILDDAKNEPSDHRQAALICLSILITICCFLYALDGSQAVWIFLRKNFG